MTRRHVLLGALCTAAAILIQPLVSCAGDQPKTVLVFSLTKGFRHGGAIEKGNPILQNLAEDLGYVCVVTENPSAFDPQNIGKWDCIIFNNTTGELFTEPERKDAFLKHVKGGAGFIGIHAATDTFYNWPEYGEMINGYFDGHPWNQEVTVEALEPEHKLMAPFGKSWKVKDEIYQFRNFDADKVRVLMRIDNGSIDVAKGKREDQFYATCWLRKFGDGRVLYNAHGHDANVFQDKPFQEHMKLAMKWACGDMKVETDPTP